MAVIHIALRVNKKSIVLLFQMAEFTATYRDEEIMNFVNSYYTMKFPLEGYKLKTYSSVVLEYLKRVQKVEFDRINILADILLHDYTVEFKEFDYVQVRGEHLRDSRFKDISKDQIPEKLRILIEKIKLEDLEESKKIKKEKTKKTLLEECREIYNSVYLKQIAENYSGECFVCGSRIKISLNKYNEVEIICKKDSKDCQKHYSKVCKDFINKTEREYFTEEVDYLDEIVEREDELIFKLATTGAGKSTEIANRLAIDSKKYIVVVRTHQLAEQIINSVARVDTKIKLTHFTTDSRKDISHEDRVKARKLVTSFEMTREIGDTVELRDLMHDDVMKRDYVVIDEADLYFNQIRTIPTNFCRVRGRILQYTGEITEKNINSFEIIDKITLASKTFGDVFSNFNMDPRSLVRLDIPIENYEREENKSWPRCETTKTFIVHYLDKEKFTEEDSEEQKLLNKNIRNMFEPKVIEFVGSLDEEIIEADRLREIIDRRDEIALPEQVIGSRILMGRSTHAHIELVRRNVTTVCYSATMTGGMFRYLSYLSEQTGKKLRVIKVRQSRRHEGTEVIIVSMKRSFISKKTTAEQFEKLINLGLLIVFFKRNEDEAKKLATRFRKYPVRFYSETMYKITPEEGVADTVIDSQPKIYFSSIHGSLARGVNLYNYAFVAVDCKAYLPLHVTWQQDELSSYREQRESRMNAILQAMDRQRDLSRKLVLLYNVKENDVSDAIKSYKEKGCIVSHIEIDHDGMIPGKDHYERLIKIIQDYKVVENFEEIEERILELEIEECSRKLEEYFRENPETKFYLAYKALHLDRRKNWIRIKDSLKNKLKKI